MTDNKTIKLGCMVKQARKEQGLTQEQLAAFFMPEMNTEEENSSDPVSCR